jgi:hypothetical protein
MMRGPIPVAFNLTSTFVAPAIHHAMLPVYFGAPQGLRHPGGLVGVQEAVSPASSSSGAGSPLGAHAKAAARAHGAKGVRTPRPRSPVPSPTPGPSVTNGGERLPALSPPGTATRPISRSRSGVELTTNSTTRADVSSPGGSLKAGPGHGHGGVNGKGKLKGKGTGGRTSPSRSQAQLQPPPPLQLSGLLDASETATAYAVAQKRVTTEYLHSPLVMHKVRCTPQRAPRVGPLSGFKCWAPRNSRGLFLGGRGVCQL